uniref:exodeoxyribonuclease III n=1 Tax=Gallus gallus TaxID=9031 RepID=A0A8V0WZG9_CHICK
MGSLWDPSVPMGSLWDRSAPMGSERPLMGSLTRRYGAEAEVVSAKSPREAAAPYVDPPVREETADGRPYNFKVTSWNVDGLRAWVRKGGLQWLQSEAPDVVCLQETKCGAESIPSELSQLPHLPHKFWGSAVGRSGYSGVGLLSRTAPIRVTHGIGPRNPPDPKMAPPDPKMGM